jgi:hypothetical protein
LDDVTATDPESTILCYQSRRREIRMKRERRRRKEEDVG